MQTRRTVFAGMFAVVALPAAAQEFQLISPQQAHDNQQSGAMALVDVRTPDEWKAGVAEGAEKIAMQDAQLEARLEALVAGDRTAPVALICRTGARSGLVAAWMIRKGFTNVYSVNGGMLGSPTGPGWRRSGLPVVSAP